jgi:predicted nucleic acid-binding protein
MKPRTPRGVRACSEASKSRHVPRSFAFDALLACSCRENGIVLVTRNSRDMQRIRRVFILEHVAPHPEAV